MDPKPKRQPVPAGGQPIPATITAADATPPVEKPAATTDTAPAVEPPVADAGSEQAAGADMVDDGELVEARVLVAFGDHAANDIFTAPAAEVERQKLAGNVDPHPDAVTFAKSLGEDA
ncbi:hypothetical protein [Sphingomonas sp. Leaf37]|uniref:hypothetical protein n=1 Tax=Sphingomonas sp. Leaf37 TaxID=2876552 RepID=UPI001E3E10B0|nr:hypothetical protein [Sphingomonas sp. Leaf37]